MSLKELVIVKDGNEQRLLIQKDRLVIGRDKKSDIVIDDSSISRRHAVVISKFESVYIENVSSTGRLEKGSEAIEYAELLENEEVQMGPFTLFWRAQDGKEVGRPTPQAADLSADAPPLQSISEGNNDSVHPAQNLGAVPSLDLPVVPENPPAQEPEVFQAIDSAHTNFSSNNTQIVLSRGSLNGLLRISKGTLAGKEYKLDHGATWIVGRHEKCQIFVDHPKLSRQHFQIVRIGNAFRVQDLSSAHGTRLNGVAISDAPLQAFDTLQAGSLEFQFLIIDAQKFVEAPALNLAEANELNPPPPNMGGHFSESPQDKTQFAPPTLYNAEKFSQESPIGNAPPKDSSAPPSGAQAIFSAPLFSGLSGSDKPWAKVVIWIQDQPKQKQALYGGALILIAATLLILSLGSGSSTNRQIASVPNTKESPNALPKINVPNAADMRDVSSEYNLLSQEKQSQVKDHYARAERARSARDWTGAFENSKAIFDLGVKRYKNAAEIMDEAQTYLNEGALGNISKSLSTLKDAQDDVAEKVKLLNENGEAALKEKRWNDATESFLKALTLNPNDDRAGRGYAAAQSKNADLGANMPVIQVADEDFVEAQREREELDGSRRIYQDTKSKMQNGNFREALPHLKKLEKDLSARIEEYEAGDRAPAAYRSGIKQETKSLQSQVREALETTQVQLRSEYAPQLADAEQLINNKQYSEARETYDRIIRSNPYFEEAMDARERLYAKLLTEAKTLYHEALIYESVSDINNAIDGYKKSKDMLTNVNNPTAIEYFKKSLAKLRRLEP